ncbi:hypothetical protein KCP73_23155 [Salmonella enterica subsp. enterica]|nr:hypothetical protein KCP73_23155 [Salmonella enterica subsp. enterica]
MGRHVPAIIRRDFIIDTPLLPWYAVITGLQRDMVLNSPPVLGEIAADFLRWEKRLPDSDAAFRFLSCFVLIICRPCKGCLLGGKLCRLFHFLDE